MKLATLKRGGRDGTVVVVSADQRLAIEPFDRSVTMQHLLDTWDTSLPALQLCSRDLNSGKAPSAFFFLPADTAAPLPRAYAWLDGSAYVNHVELVRRARGAPMPDSLWHDPIMYQGGSDTFLGPHDPIPLDPDGTWDLDFEAEVAVVLDDVPIRPTREEASAAIRLIVLVNDVSLRGLIPAELSKGFGFLHGKPSTAFAPLAVTPDELGSVWDGAKLAARIEVRRNGELFGSPRADVDMTFDFPRLIMHAAETRKLSTGTILGAGTVSNQSTETGSCCITERRTLEILQTGSASTNFLQVGENVRIDAWDVHGNSIFGSIDQRVEVLDAGLRS